MVDLDQMTEEVYEDQWEDWEATDIEWVSVGAADLMDDFGTTVAAVTLSRLEIHSLVHLRRSHSL